MTHRTSKELDRLIARVDAGARASTDSAPGDLGIALVRTHTDRIARGYD